MKKLKILVSLKNGQVAFTIFKTKNLSRVEILGILKVISWEINNQLQDKLNISKV